jgi:DNA-binding response OmpR family regulator
MKLLLIEDDQTLARALLQALKAEDFVVEAASDGKSALSLCRAMVPDIAILDLGLPDIDGVALLGKLRAVHRSLAILVLTARDGITDKVAALDAGADDYLIKPFETAELMARLRVLARRLGTADSAIIEVGAVKVDLSNHSVSFDNEPLPLTRREYMLLKALVESAGRVLTKEVLEQRLYGWGEEVASNTIEVHISNLRKKLPEHLIQTIRGVGYTVGRG